MRIKVLDVLSFVLLINRQFYEVRSGLKPGWGVLGWGLLWALDLLQGLLGVLSAPLYACFQLAFFLPVHSIVCLFCHVLVGPVLGLEAEEAR